MDNTIIPYQDTNETSEEELDDSSSEDEHSHLLSNNVGVLYNQFITNETFMNMENQQHYQKNRNKLFTPEIIKRYFTIHLTTSTITRELKKHFKLPTKNIIGFKMIKSNFEGNGGTNMYIDLSIPEIPEIACDKDEEGRNIFARIPLRKADDFYTHQYLELSLINRYFYPINLDRLTFNLSPNLSPSLEGFVVIEISYLNEKVHNDS
tara:strand:- start:205 stop:825 length:621 start_codon:yes stop_codon:yes gene_type:complete